MPTLNSSLTKGLNTPVTIIAQNEIVGELWPNGVSASPISSQSRPDGLDWERYFEFYREECEAALSDEGRHFAPRNHHHILEITRLLADELSQDDVKMRIQQAFPLQGTPEDKLKTLNVSITVAVRVYAMINLRQLPYEIYVGGTLFVQWGDGSLRENIHCHFNRLAALEPNFDDHVITPYLTAWNTEHISDIRVIPTNNLADHLLLVAGQSRLCVFHHVPFLERMRSVQSDMFPPGLIEETIDTLKLLFPDNDRKTQQWLKNEPMFDIGLLKYGNPKSKHQIRRLKRYKFWQDRLGVLEEVVDEATPPSRALLRALKDNKRGDGWLNSWVAVVAIGLTLFFGLVQSIEGAIQVYKAYHPAAG